MLTMIFLILGIIDVCHVIGWILIPGQIVVLFVMSRYLYNFVVDAKKKEGSRPLADEQRVVFFSKTF
jgi:hypothetical protein